MQCIQHLICFNIITNHPLKINKWIECSCWYKLKTKCNAFNSSCAIISSPPSRLFRLDVEKALKNIRICRRWNINAISKSNWKCPLGSPVINCKWESELNAHVDIDLISSILFVMGACSRKYYACIQHPICCM